MIIDFTQLKGGMIRSEYLGDLFFDSQTSREGVKVLALIRREVVKMTIYGIRGGEVG